MDHSLEVNATRLRENLYQTLDQVLATGEPVAIVRKGRRLLLSVAAEPKKTKRESLLSRLEPHPNAIKGDPDDLIHIDWLKQWKPFI